MKNIVYILFLMPLLSLGQIIEFEDPVFKSKLLEADQNNNVAYDVNGKGISIDANNNGVIEVEEAAQVKILNISGSIDSEIKIQDLSGIEYFINLKELNCTENQISNMNFSKNLKLEILSCGGNELLNLDVTKNTALTRLSCNVNRLSVLDVSNNKRLNYLACSSNPLEVLDVSELTQLTDLWCNDTKISKLDLSKQKSLTFLSCYANQLNNLDLSNQSKLKTIYCKNNPLTDLDLSNQSELFFLDCRNTSITSLNIKNGSELSYLFLDDNSSLDHICIDEKDFSLVQTEIQKHDYKDVVISSYCSFTPGGEFYTIKVKNFNCKDENIYIPNLKYEVSDGTTTGVFLSPIKSDAHTIPLQVGNYVVTPKLDNPDLYTITPTSINVSFPEQKSPYIQDFCITPIADINDLEISMTPLGDPARPGFDATYKIIYKNKGTTTLSGTINLNYMDDVLDYVTANPAFTSYGDYQLNWDFEDLKPFGTREIEITFNTNSPQETPPVNNDDLLNFNVQLSYDGEDQTPEDNSFELRQTVVGSYDPNDKTCMQGKEVLEDMIGQYVHYRIRFENTGTFPAQNIVVVDEIDESKFDVSTLVPLDASHDFETRIKGNKVEFIFEGIQLPFEDDSNDGYVFFKIKTLPTLKLGDSFSNQASIYFDFNFPIITNNETTTIVEEHLGVGDFEFNEELTAYPNPVADRLYIAAKSDAELHSLEIYNLQGQMVLSVPQVSKMSFDLSHLPKGTYVVKIKTIKGVTSTKISKL